MVILSLFLGHLPRDQATNHGNSHVDVINGNNLKKYTMLRFLLFAGFLADQTSALQGYYGTKIGDLSELHHGVSGSVYAVDARTLFLKNFNYDGEGPGK